MPRGRGKRADGERAENETKSNSNNSLPVFLCGSQIPPTQPSERLHAAASAASPGALPVSGGAPSPPARAAPAPPPGTAAAPPSLWLARLPAGGILPPGEFSLRPPFEPILLSFVWKKDKIER